MSVPVQDPINQFIITGGETSGPWTWNLQKEEDLVVFKQLASTKAIVPLVRNTDYTVNPAGLNNDNGGTITFLAPQLPAAVGDIWTLLRDTAIDRSQDFATKGAFLAKTINGQLDELTRIAQDQKRDIGTAVRKDPGVGDTLNPLIPQPVDERALKFRDAGGGNFDLVMSDGDPDQQTNDAANSAAAALASEQAAAISETGAETAETGAETAETGAETAESGAQTAQAAAEAAAASGLYKNVFDIDFSDSPFTILSSQDGFLIQVDTTGGNVIVNLPDSTGLSADFRVGVARMTAGGNTLDVQRQGTDTINGVTSVPIDTQYQTLNLILDQSQGEYLATDISLANLSSPPAIGDVTPNSIEGTIIKANTRFEGPLGSTNPAAVKATTFEGNTGGTTINEFSIDGTLAGNSDDAVPTEKAVKTYADTKIADAAGVVDQANLKTSTQELSITFSGSPQNMNFTSVGEYGFHFQDRNDAAGKAWAGYATSTSFSSTSYTTHIIVQTNISPMTLFMRHRFVQASPPYDLGDGAVHTFIYAVIENKTGKIFAMNISQDPPWIYHSEFGIKRAMVFDDPKTKKRMYVKHAKFDPTQPNAKELFENPPASEIVEYNNALKIEAMPLFPHPYHDQVWNKLNTEKESVPDLDFWNRHHVALIDPVSKTAERLDRMCECGDETLKLFHDGYLKIDNTDIENRKRPNGVACYGARWK